MSKTLALEVDFLELLLNGTPLANVWDNAASSPISIIYVSAHSADPGESGLQNTNEIAYGDYARIGVARDGTGWTIDPLTGIAVPAHVLEFPTPTSGSGTITHIGIGRDATGPGYLFASGTLTSNIIVTVGTPPTLTTASSWTED